MKKIIRVLSLLLFFTAMLPMTSAAGYLKNAEVFVAFARDIGEGESLADTKITIKHANSYLTADVPIEITAISALKGCLADSMTSNETTDKKMETGNTSVIQMTAEGMRISTENLCPSTSSNLKVTHTIFVKDVELTRTTEFNMANAASTDFIKDQYDGKNQYDGIRPAANVTATQNLQNLTTNSYTLKFLDGFGGVISTAIIKYGASISYPEAPTREGMKFAGWDTEIGSTMPDHDVTVTAKWTVNSYTLTINGDSKQVDYGTALTAPTDPTAEGKTFTGWTWTVGGKTVASMPTTMPAANVTATPNWTTNSYTLKFLDGFGKEISSETIKYGASISYPADPAREGMKFAGWDTEIGSTMPDHDVTVTAKWTVNSYTLKFLDGFGKEISSETFQYGASISYPAKPTREGMKFAGWDTKIGSTMPDHDVTVTAKWTVNSYTLTINGDSKQVDYGTALTAPADPTAEGKAFTGWTWTVGGKTVATMPTTMPAANVTATPNWTTNSYTLQFLDGFGGVISSETIQYGASISYPADPAREGMRFEGWDTETGSTMPDHDVTVTAKWTVNSYTLTINGDSKQVDYGTALTAPVAPDAPEGQTFTGWTWTVDGTTVASMPTTMPAANVTATPNWTTNSYTLQFLDGFGGVISSEMLQYGASISYPADPAREGMEFAGWDTETGSTMPDHDVTVTARWTVNSYTLTINGESIPVAYGTTLTTPAAPTAPEGKTFTGWTWTVGGTTVASMPTTMPVANVTATPNWTTNSYTLQFLDGFGGVISSETIQYGASISYPADPAREGMEFAGWDTETGSTMPAHDVTVTARWTVNSYTLTINGESSLVAYGTTLTAPAAPTAPEGKTFTGWTWTVGGATVASMPTTMPAANVTATANWQDKEVTKYTVTFYLDGEEYYSAQYAEGETIVAPDPPVGYVWYPALEEFTHMPGYDLSFDALPFAE